MDWQQIAVVDNCERHRRFVCVDQVPSAKLRAAAGTLIVAAVRRAHSGLKSSIVFHARKGEAPRITVKM
jgi:hypothetical protein